MIIKLDFKEFKMKNKFFSVIAIAVVTIGIIALSMTGCDNGTNNPPLTEIPAPTVITIAAIDGVTVPVTGEPPVTTITENAQYSGTVTWNGNPAIFAASTAYTATITLTPKTGYTLQGVTANFFTVVETTSVTNEANSGVITAVFAATDRDYNLDYITVWPNPKTKQITVQEGTKTVALLATGKYCDVYYDRNVTQPTELQLKQTVFVFDNGYEKATSLLGLYETSSGPNAGTNGIPRIQTYIYNLYPAGGRYNPSGNEKSIYLDIYNINERSFTHELCHLIYYRNGSVRPETWYHEFLPTMSEVVFNNAGIDWSTPNVQLFGVWNNDGGPSSAGYYTTYRKLAKFLVSKYGDSVFYDLYHETAINKQALENVLRKKGTTLQTAEVEFANWCDNFGYPNDNETRIIIIDNVTLTSRVGVWLAANIPSGYNVPINTAIQSGAISNNKIVFSLVVPNDNTWSTGPAWLGSGDYYVYVVPIFDNSYQWNNALIYTGGGTTPLTVTFNKAITRLSYTDFKIK
jgi:hypothetical protein